MKILIAGAGALGSNIAKNLVADLKGEHEITVLDYDKVEKRNVQAGTQFYTPDQVGLLKVEALQFNLYKWYQREVQIEPRNIMALINWDHDLLIDCFDNEEARAYVQSQHIFPFRGEMLHVGFSDQFTFPIEWAKNYTVPSDITSGMDICEMEGASSFVNMVSALASLVVQDFLTKKEQAEYVGNRLGVRKVA